MMLNERERNWLDAFQHACATGEIEDAAELVGVPPRIAGVLFELQRMAQSMQFTPDYQAMAREMAKAIKPKEDWKGEE